jgi:hypothetical protein
MVLIVWPLLFPEPLQGLNWVELVGGLLAYIACFSSFGVTGFLLCRRLTRRFVHDDGSITVLFR